MKTTKQLMLVEDDEHIRQIFCKVLQTEGYDVVEAANGRDALDLLRSSSQLPGLIILDLMMPVMNGQQLLLASRDIPGMKDVPVAVISASADIVDVVGATMTLEKPLELSTLLEVAATHLQ